jgi:hypothetical protein
MWWKRKKELPRSNSHRNRMLAAMREDAENAGIFADFIVEALNRGYAMRLFVEVDGVTCKSGLLFPGGDFVEYLANWACAQKILKGIKLRKFEMEGQGQNLPNTGVYGESWGDKPPGFEYT